MKKHGNIFIITNNKILMSL